MGKWSDRLQDLQRRIEDLVRDLAGVRAEPDPVLVPVPVRSRPTRAPDRDPRR